MKSRKFLWGLTLELIYPKVPGALTPQEIIDKISQGELPQMALFPLLLKYIFAVAVTYGGIFLFLYLIYLGLRYFYFSFGSPAALTEVRKKIKNVVFALVFFLFSLFVVSTLNPFQIIGAPTFSSPPLANLPSIEPAPSTEFVVIPLGKITETASGRGAMLQAMAHEIWKVSNWLPECERDPDKCPPWDWRYWEKKISFKRKEKNKTSPLFSSQQTFGVTLSAQYDLVEWYLKTQGEFSSGESLKIEEFQCQEKIDPTGEDFPQNCKKGSFKLFKNNNYELYSFDENYIYLVEDTSWAVGPNQDVMCVIKDQNGQLSEIGQAKQVRYGAVLSEEKPGEQKNSACQIATSSSQFLGQKFAPRYLEESTPVLFSQEGYVLGFAENRANTCCVLSRAPGQGDISGPLQVNVETKFVGCVFLEKTGVLSQKTIKIEEKNTGKVWLLNPEKGLIGWYSYKNGFGSFTTQGVDPVPSDGPPPGCQVISDTGFTETLPSEVALKEPGIKVYSYAETGETPPQACFLAELRLNGIDPATGEVDYSLIFKSGSRKPGVKIERLIIGAPTNEGYQTMYKGVGVTQRDMERLRFFFETEHQVLPSLPYYANSQEYFEIEKLWLPKVIVKPGKSVKLLVRIITSPTGLGCGQEEGQELKRQVLEYTLVLGQTLAGQAIGGLYSYPYDSLPGSLQNSAPAFIIPSGNSLSRCLEVLYSSCSCTAGEGTNLQGQCSPGAGQCQPQACQGNPCQRVIDVNSLGAECTFLKNISSETLLSVAPKEVLEHPLDPNQTLPFDSASKKLSLEPTIEFLNNLLEHQIESLKERAAALEEEILIAQSKQLELAVAKFLMNNTYPYPIPEPVFRTQNEEALRQNKIKIKKLRPWYGYQIEPDPLNFYLPARENEDLINMVENYGILIPPIDPQELERAGCFFSNIRALPLPSLMEDKLEEAYRILSAKGITVTKSLLASILRLETLGLLVEGGQLKECQNVNSLSDTNCCTTGSEAFGDSYQDLICFAGAASYSSGLCTASSCSSMARTLNGCGPDERGQIMPLNIKRVFDLLSINTPTGPRYYGKALENLPVSGIINQGSIVQCGGAMGPMQIMSGNWIARQLEIKNMVGKIPSPYNLLHALLYAGVHIRDTARDAVGLEPSCLAIRMAGYRYNGDPRYGACLQELYNQYATLFGELPCAGE